MKNALVKTDNQLIINRRKRRAIKRTIISLVLLVSVTITLCLKLTYFNIAYISVINNHTINSDEIVKLSKINKGINIFYLNFKSVQTNLQSNPYILSADISRKLPNTIVISIKEREAVFYSKRDNKYLIIDKNGIVLEEKDDISQMKLTNLQGFDTKEVKIGEVIPSQDKRKIENISLITELISNNSSGIDITSIDLSNDLNLLAYSNNMCIKLGNGNIKDKLNKALNVIVTSNLKDQKGYIDVSYEGNPVIFTEK
ncbi:FtsQ-type POTRA domain-containing protein [Clostridium sp. YIM B02515]|uniref:FtsQ-type POTRA domain-containing protein n=1 Tax=Clostridium rhizosphaerae TaxID=2803861 RepID=A0ABS1TF04_9CLOT|nr:FtsQ-type POTRA domain-containing protein [Clostridium rhizosphaerae]MBL4937950.1 FtsQ-type POTRA domain-containing protein [Clostridium rhizosphaerae]